MVPRLARTLTSLGSVTFAIGLVVWYATPKSSIGVPVALAIVGIIACGIGWFAGGSRSGTVAEHLDDCPTRSPHPQG